MEINKEIDHLHDTLYSLEKGNDYLDTDKIHVVYKSINLVMDLFCKDESIRFTTLFSKISWVTNKLDIKSNWIYKIQLFRRSYERGEINESNVDKYLELGIVVCHNLICYYEENISKLRELSPLTNDYFKYEKASDAEFKKIIECLITSVDTTNTTFTFIDELQPDLIKIAKYDIHDKNEIFTNNLNKATSILGLPITANLIDIIITKEGMHQPTAIIINPDYLIDVTAIASAVKDDEGDHWLYILNKLYDKDLKNLPILIGNLVNHILDLLINNADISFEEITKSFFHLDPLTWSIFDDNDVKNAMVTLEKHYHNIQRIIKEDFINHDIFKENIYLEPSFYSRTFGIQGRLDMLHLSEKLADIIELKSSKPFKPNVYGITQSHFNQALLYDLIFSSSDYQKLKRNTYILYSILDQSNLKYANIIKSKQYELMKIRNELVLMDYALASDTVMTAKIVNYLKPGNFQGISGFTLTNLNTFESLFLSLSLIEKEYHIQFINFINREHILTKTGDSNYDSYNGQASLWLNTEEEKKDRFSILNYLQIVENNSENETAIIKLQYTSFSSRLSNFRKGDIVVFYPHHFNSANILKHQIFKCSLINVDENFVEIRLRNSQKNQSIFKSFDYWNIEQDVLDSSFKHMYKNLFYLISSEDEKRKLILGLQKPAMYKQQTLQNLDDELTNEQKKIINNIFSCKDYYLLWGPPGTGKTNLVLKHLSKVLYENTNEKIFLIAYTNRAVDEICQALKEVGLGQEYTRIGSSFSVSEETKPHLLNEKIKGFTKRKEIVNLITGTRIFVSTASSLMGKLEIFNITEFDTIIVDEASQILEPMLCGILTKFKKFVLIGDHKQLPAVVAQKDSETQINNPLLNEIGFTSTKTSLFERLYSQCIHNNWIHSYDILSHQGRMHQDIMSFVNSQFYESKLRLLTKLERLTSPIQSLYPLNQNHWLANHRMVYINSQTETSAKWKTNDDEAMKVSYVVKSLKEIYLSNDREFDENKIGIITPYRAQISLIKSYLPLSSTIMVDTVERFQGGAKDIIIISLCTNKLSQLNTLVVKSNQGVDRKLNVALTRAKEQIIIIGNKEILATNKVYEALINYCYEVSYK